MTPQRLDILTNLLTALLGYALLWSFDWRLAAGLALINGARNGMESNRRQMEKQQHANKP